MAKKSPPASAPGESLDQIRGGEIEWTLEACVAAQDGIEAESLRWLGYCKQLAGRRLPPAVFETIPDDIWRFRLWGTKCVIMRTPDVTKQGSIIVPDSAKRDNDIGWIITVGGNIHETEEMNVRGKTYPYGVHGMMSPLLAVGDLVLFNPYAGKSIVTNFLDTGLANRSKMPKFLLISIADVWGPMVDVKQSDWSSEQETPTSLLVS